MKEISLLFIGDVVGEKSLENLLQNLVPLQDRFSANLTVINGENIWQGKGLNKKHANDLFEAGCDVITTGNHIWENWKSRPLISENPKVLRPFNYPTGNPGRGYYIHEMSDGTKVAIVQLQGRTFMQHIDCPFKGADYLIDTISSQTKNIIFDFHADATAEKVAMGWHVDGRVSAVLGTHTHIQTADSQILPEGTAYITDVGMTGPYNSVIGMSKEVALKRYILQTAHKYEDADGDYKICGANVKIDTETGRSTSIEPFVYPKFQNTNSK